MPLCRFGDLVVDSDLPLPETASARRGPATCRVRVVSAGDAAPGAAAWTHHWRSPGGEVSVSYGRAGDGHRLGFPGLAEFVVRGDGREIWCRPLDETPEATLRHLLLDQVLPRVLSLRGLLVLHAGCVADGASGHVLLGRSGAGKSTLVAALGARGFAVVSDDCSIVARDASGPFIVQGSYPGIRLCPDALEVIAGRAAPTSPVAHYTAKRRMAQDPGAAAHDPVALRGVYVLDETDDGPAPPAAVDAQRLRGSDAYVAILRSLFQLEPEDPAASRARFDLVGALVREVPVQRLRYARSFEALDAVAEETGTLFVSATAARPERTARDSGRGSGPRAVS